MASSSASKLHVLVASVQDSTEFPENSEAPGLRSLDTVLRCPICSEFFDGPVTLKCGHCFCSLCVRQSLLVKQECPTCRETDVNEVHLRINSVMEEAVCAWKLSRPFTLQLLAEEKQRREAPSRPTKKRKIADNSDDEIICIASPSKKASTSYIADSNPSRPPVSRNNERGSATQPDSFIECPSCSKRIQFKDINKHLDRDCKDESEQSSKSQWASILGAKSQAGKASKRKGKERALPEDDDESPLPKKSYDTLKDKAIREILQESGLPTNGDRSTMIARHERWVVIYNANLDKSRKLRKSPDALRKELQQWETQQKGRMKHDISDPVAYQKKQKSEFDKLVEAARIKKPASNGATSAREDQPDSNAQSSKAAPQSKSNPIVIDAEEESAKK